MARCRGQLTLWGNWEVMVEWNPQYAPGSDTMFVWGAVTDTGEFSCCCCHDVRSHHGHKRAQAESAVCAGVVGGARQLQKQVHGVAFRRASCHAAVTPCSPPPGGRTRR